MPRELVAVAPRTAALRDYQELPLGAGQVRIRSRYSAVKHGTELRSFRADTRDASAPFDWSLGLHLTPEQAAAAARRRGGARIEPAPARAPAAFPRPLGNATVGEVTAVAADVQAFAIGDLVYGALPIRETHTVAAARLQAVPPGMLPAAVVCWDPASVALSGIRDAALGVGDYVLVTGLGAIGQMAVQLARLQGAQWVAASDPIERRRALATGHGADLALDPVASDAALEVKLATPGPGVDLVIETSGSYSGLNDALRATAYGGTVVSVAYYHGDARALGLEGEWHRNRIKLLSSRDVSAPHRLSPRWDVRRLAATAFELLRSGALSADGVLDPVVPFAESAAAYQAIDRDPAASIKLGITYP